MHVHEELWSLTRPAEDERHYDIQDFRATAIGDSRIRVTAPPTCAGCADELTDLLATEDLIAWLRDAGVHRLTGRDHGPCWQRRAGARMTVEGGGA